ncbi:MAG: glycosyltransferase family protein [Candidatus Omnitrophota bacterium]
MKIGAIVQARTSSTRLPGKVLKELPLGSGITVLEQVIRRLKRSKKLNTIVIATTTDAQDDAIVEVVRKENVVLFRGSRDDVLSRFYLAAKENGLDVVVRITSDCPCMDPDVLDMVISTHLENKGDYTSNTLKRTYPRGLDVEVLNFDVLEGAYENAEHDFEKEHVTSYIYDTHPNMFKIDHFTAPEGFDASDIRATLDTEEDYKLLCTVFNHLYEENEFFGVKDLIAFIEEQPWVKSINDNVVQKNIQEEKGNKL